MSKSTKIIAALGVAAGLGVAALPISTFAADPVMQTVTLTVNDDLGIEVAGNVASSANVTGSMTPNAVLELTGTSGESGAAQNATATVTTYSNYGYNLTAIGGNSGVLKSATTGTFADTIQPFATLQESLAVGTDNAGAGWGIKVASTAVAEGVTATYGTIEEGKLSNAGYFGLATSKTLVSTNGPAISGSATYIDYGFVTRNDQKADTYTGTITFTAATNDN